MNPLTIANELSTMETEVIRMKINPRIFYANVRALRMENEWSQAQLAVKVGLDPKNYSNKERGSANRVPMDLAEKIAEVFGTTVESLATGEEPEEPLFDPEIVSFFSRVRTKRESLGISQKVMAERLDMSPTNWSTKESGKISRLPSSLVQQIAEVLGCTVEELRGENVSVNPAVTVDVVVEKPKESHSNSSYSISHLSEPIQRFISKKENKEIVEKSIKDFVLLQYMGEE